MRSKAALEIQLSTVEAKFCRGVADGLQAAQAYRAATGGRVTAESARSLGYRLMKRPHIRTEIARLQAEALEGEDAKRLPERTSKRQELAHIMFDRKNYTARDRIAAIKADNRMTGDDAPKQVQVLDMTKLLELIRDANRPTLHPVN